MIVAGFPHQVGGHFGLLKCAGHVLKPFNQREALFYTHLDSRFAPFTVQYCGRVRVHLDHGGRRGGDASAMHRDCEEDESTILLMVEEPAKCHNLHGHSDPPMTFRVGKSGKVEATASFNSWAGYCQSKVIEKMLKGHSQSFITLENIVSNYHVPCIIDIKMGQRQYGDECSAQKRAAQTQKCRQSTSQELGIRLVGMQLYDRHRAAYDFVNKYEGRRMTKTQLADYLVAFFVVAGQHRTENLLKQLEMLESVVQQAESFRFFSSSLLIAFDGASEAVDQPEIVMRMIDFAHSTYAGFLNDSVYEGIDDGYALGISSLASIVKTCAITTPPKSVALTHHAKMKPQRSLKRRYSSSPTRRRLSSPGGNGNGNNAGTRMTTSLSGDPNKIISFAFT